MIYLKVPKLKTVYCFDTDVQSAVEWFYISVLNQTHRQVVLSNNCESLMDKNYYVVTVLTKIVKKHYIFTIKS